MTFDELDVYGRLRKVSKSGPLSMFERLMNIWTDLKPREIAEKVKMFFYHYSVNRHKQTVMTPGYHGDNYGAEDSRFDQRPFLYDCKWEI